MKVGIINVAKEKKRSLGEHLKNCQSSRFQKSPFPVISQNDSRIDRHGIVCSDLFLRSKIIFKVLNENTKACS